MLVNKELERQNDILLSDRLDRYYASQSQMIQAIATPNIPPELKMYYCESLLATSATMQTLLRNFNKDNTDTHFLMWSRLSKLPKCSGAWSRSRQWKYQGSGPNHHIASPFRSCGRGRSSSRCWLISAECDRKRMKLYALLTCIINLKR